MVDNLDHSFDGSFYSVAEWEILLKMKKEKTKAAISISSKYSMCFIY